MEWVTLLRTVIGNAIDTSSSGAGSVCLVPLFVFGSRLDSLQATASLHSDSRLEEYGLDDSRKVEGPRQQQKQKQVVVRPSVSVSHTQRAGQVRAGVRSFAHPALIFLLQTVVLRSADPLMKQGTTCAGNARTDQESRRLGAAVPA